MAGGRESALSDVPLRLRLKNPPGVFLGRMRESEWLKAALERAAACVVFGIGGLGKTSLVLATLHKAFPERVARTLMIGLSPSDREPEQAVARAIAEVSGASLEGLESAPDALVAQVLDLADASGFWFVIEDAHHADPERLRAFLRTVTTYARASRWIVTSRVDPLVPELLGQALGLGAMDSEDLRELARSCAPGALSGDVDRAASAAAGSPWRLRQLLLDPGRSATDELDVLSGLAEATAHFLVDLAVLETPCPVELLATFTAVPEAAELRALEARGILEPGLSAVRLHDVARGLLGTAAAPHRAREIAEALERTGDAEAALEAARLHVESGRFASATACLAPVLEVLVRKGHAGRLFQLLAGASGDEARHIKLRCAKALGGAAALGWVTSLPEPEPLVERLWWAESLHLAAKAEAAVEAAGRLSTDARAAGDEATAVAACLLQARALLVTGRADLALAALDEANARSRDDRMRTSGLRVRALASAARFREGLELAERLADDLDGLSSAAIRDVELGMLGLFLTSGRPRKASAIVERMRARRDAGADIWVSLNVSATELTLAIEEGRLAAARELVPRVTRLVEGAPGLQLLLQLSELRLALAEGDFRELRARVERGTDQAAALGIVRAIHWFRHIELLVAWATNARARTREIPRSSQAGPTELYMATLDRLAAARAGLEEPGEELDVEALPDIVYLRLTALFARATRDLVAGDADAARAGSRAVVELAEEHGYALWEADARSLLCDALAVLGRSAELRAEVEILGARAAVLGSRRYDAEAAVARATFGGEVPDAAALEVLTGGSDVAPSAARRARSVLDESTAAPDAVDRTVVAALRAGGSAVTLVRAGASGPFQRGFGLDHTNRTVWLPDGRRIDFSKNDLFWNFLSSLERHGGTATKEELVREVWGVPKYHALRDDKRMQVAVRRIRTSLEDVPSNPKRLVTTDVGYAFGLTEPVRRTGPPLDPA